MAPLRDSLPALLGGAVVVTVLVVVNGLVLGGTLPGEGIAVLVAGELLAGVVALGRARRRAVRTGTGAERPRRRSRRRRARTSASTAW